MEDITIADEKLIISNESMNNRRTEPFRPIQLGFGTQFTDNIFLMEYRDGKWKNPRIVPFGSDLGDSPAAIKNHYAAGSSFEGLKAFKLPNGELGVWRADKNAERMRQSSKITGGPDIQEEDFTKAVHALVDFERNWYPEGLANSSLYIRPFINGVTKSVHVTPGEDFTCCVMLSPSGPYFGKGFDPVQLLLTDYFKRVPKGRMGRAKSPANYAMSIDPSRFGREFGASQVLYTDHRDVNITETGAMNFFVVSNGGVYIPEFNDEILESITSLSFLELSSTGKLGFEVKQNTIAKKMLLENLRGGLYEGMGGLGTAAVVAPVNELLVINDKLVTGQVIDDIIANGFIPGNHPNLVRRESAVKPVHGLATKMLQVYQDMQYGRTEAPDGWLQVVQRR